MFDVKKNLKGDIEAAELLNISQRGLAESLERVSGVEANAVRAGIYRPYEVSAEVQRAIYENANALDDVANPLREAMSTINILGNEMSRLSLDLPDFPVFENPLMPIMQDTPITPTSLNLPQVDGSALQNQVSGGSFSSLSNRQKFDILFPNG